MYLYIHDSLRPQCQLLYHLKKKKKEESVAKDDEGNQKHRTAFV